MSFRLLSPLPRWDGHGLSTDARFLGARQDTAHEEANLRHPIVAGRAAPYALAVPSEGIGPAMDRESLGPYEILEPLGSGDMGDVYRAHDPNLRRDVAIKVLPVELPTRIVSLASSARPTRWRHSTTRTSPPSTAWSKPRPGTAARPASASVSVP